MISEYLPITLESLLTLKTGPFAFSFPHFCLFTCLSFSAYLPLNLLDVWRSCLFTTIFPTFFNRLKITFQNACIFIST